MEFIFSKHALDEMQRRAISKDIVISVLKGPDEVVEEREGKKCFQSVLDFGSGKSFLVRVIVDDRTAPALVITAYRTSQIRKYQRKP